MSHVSKNQIDNRRIPRNETPAAKPELELDVEVLEERIAPGVNLNRCEMFTVERPKPAAKPELELDVDVLEERIAPGINLNRCETFGGLELKVEMLEERIAPGLRMNRCETLIGEQFV